MNANATDKLYNDTLKNYALNIRLMTIKNDEVFSSSLNNKNLNEDEIYYTYMVATEVKRKGNLVIAGKLVMKHAGVQLKRFLKTKINFPLLDIVTPEEIPIRLELNERNAIIENLSNGTPQTLASAIRENILMGLFGSSVETLSAVLENKINIGIKTTDPNDNHIDINDINDATTVIHEPEIPPITPLQLKTPPPTPLESIKSESPLLFEKRQVQTNLENLWKNIEQNDTIIADSVTENLSQSSFDDLNFTEVQSEYEEEKSSDFDLELDNLYETSTLHDNEDGVGDDIVQVNVLQASDMSLSGPIHTENLANLITEKNRKRPSPPPFMEPPVQTKKRIFSKVTM